MESARGDTSVTVKTADVLRCARISHASRKLCKIIAPLSWLIGLFSAASNALTQNRELFAEHAHLGMMAMEEFAQGDEISAKTGLAMPDFSVFKVKLHRFTDASHVGQVIEAMMGSHVWILMSVTI